MIRNMKIPLLSLLTITMIAPMAMLSGQTQKTMLVTDEKDNTIEISKWSVRPSGKATELEVETGEATARYAWNRIEKIEVSKNPLASDSKSRFCSLKITLRNGKVMQGILHYPAHFIEGQASDGRQYSVDFCLVKMIRFKD